MALQRCLRQLVCPVEHSTVTERQLIYLAGSSPPHVNSTGRHRGENRRLKVSTAELHQHTWADTSVLPARQWVHYFATCHPGLEPALAAELQGGHIGAQDVDIGTSGVSFR